MMHDTPFSDNHNYTNQIISVWTIGAVLSRAELYTQSSTTQ